MSQLFRRDHRQSGEAQRRVYATFEIAYTVVDVMAAVLFIIGSWMFFYEDLMTAGTWMFLIGSLCFAAKPILRLIREMRLAAMGDVEDLADRFED